MTDAEGAAVFIKLRKEYQEICDECKGLKDAILQQADVYKHLSEALRTNMDGFSMDSELAVETTRKVCSQLARYQALLAEKADKRGRLEPYGETFAPLEP